MVVKDAASANGPSRRRFALVEMASVMDAMKVLTKLHNSAFDQSILKIAFSKSLVSGSLDENMNGRDSAALTSQHRAT